MKSFFRNSASSAATLARRAFTSTRVFVPLLKSGARRGAAGGGGGGRGAALRVVEGLEHPASDRVDLERLQPPLREEGAEAVAVDELEGDVGRLRGDAQDAGDVGRGETLLRRALGADERGAAVVARDLHGGEL